MLSSLDDSHTNQEVTHTVSHPIRSANRSRRHPTRPSPPASGAQLIGLRRPGAQSVERTATSSRLSRPNSPTNNSSSCDSSAWNPPSTQTNRDSRNYPDIRREKCGKPVKRHVANEIFAILTRPVVALPLGPRLRQRRQILRNRPDRGG